MTKTKKKILFSVLSILLILAVVGGAFAWFYLNESTTIDYSNEITCEAGKSLEISLDGVNYYGSLTAQIPDITTYDISGDGVNLYVPSETNEYAEPVGFKACTMPATVTSTTSVETGGADICQYVEMTLYFRSMSKMNVYLDDSSSIDPMNEDGNPSLYNSSFSRDYCAGYTRVAFVEQAGATESLKMLWAPNPNYELSTVNGYSFNKNGTPETSYKYIVCNRPGSTNDSDYVETTIGADWYADKTFVVGKTGANTQTSGKSKCLVSLDPQNGEAQVKVIKVRIWYEGTDREAHAALSGGNINVKLKFTGISKAVNATKQSDIDSVTYNGSTFSGLKNGMQYSFDGINWSNYSGGTPTVTGKDAIFFKYPETNADINAEFETSVRKITLR